MANIRKTHIIPRATVAKLIKSAGAKRVGVDAANRLADALYEEGLEIARRAVMIARHSGRKTVNEDDIKLAYKERQV